VDAFGVPPVVGRVYADIDVVGEQILEGQPGVVGVVGVGVRGVVAGAEDVVVSWFC
jgi:hypothetical protein